jgi:hypothetical protein
MSAQSIKYRIRTLYATAAKLALANPVLLEGEPSTESDTGVKKIGDGVTPYNSLPVEVGGGDALTSGTLAQFAPTTSAQFLGVISNETGTGLVVANNGPTLIAPILGTPASATLTNCSGLPVASGISGLATGAATFLATPSSANLRALLTDEVGTGVAYFVGGALGTPASGTLTNCSGLPWTSGITGKPTTLSGYGITDAQPLDADLTAIAALTTTSFGRSFLDRASAAAGRTLLELGTAAVATTGTSSGNVVVLDGSARLPAVDGSQLTGLPADSGTKTLARFTPRDNQPPASDFATLDTRNSISVLEFNASTEETARFVGSIPEGANLASGLLVRIWWMGDTATSGNVRWAAAFEDTGTDLDADSFDTATEVTSAANGTSGIETVASITCTTIDGLAAGDRFRLRIARKGADAVNDTMLGDAQVVAVEVRGVA